MDYSIKNNILYIPYPKKNGVKYEIPLQSLGETTNYHFEEENYPSISHWIFHFGRKENFSNKYLIDLLDIIRENAPNIQFDLEQTLSYISQRDTYNHESLNPKIEKFGE